MSRERLKLELLYHDIKGPLAIIETGIMSLLNKAERYGPLTSAQERVLQRVLRNAKSAQHLVDDTLEVGRSEAGAIHAQPVKLADLLSDILIEIFDLTNAAVTKKIQSGQSLDELKSVLIAEMFYLSIDKALWEKEISLDEKKVKQILRNLLINALKYKIKRVEFEVQESDYNLFFSIADDGKGIPPIYHDKIFEGYFQLDDTEVIPVRGHGLGLAGVLILVEDMGGKLSLESDVDKGAKFMVNIPIGESCKTFKNDR
jgi:two-component system OmpR family sensor kinase